MSGCLNALSVVYRLYVECGGVRARLVEDVLSKASPMAQLTVDDHRNERACYNTLFSGKCAAVVAGIFEKAKALMNGRPFSECDEMLVALDFIQAVVCKAMWQHGCNVDRELAVFAKEYDRLDLLDERKRLHASAQSTG